MRLALLGATGGIGGHALVRASRLSNRPGTGRYRVSPDYPPSGGRKIARADVARFIAAVLTEDGWLRAAPALAY